MLTEAALLLRNLPSHLLYSFVIPFYYGSGSAKAKSYGYGSSSVTLVLVLWIRISSSNIPGKSIWSCRT
jgi:hypothetical protein